MLNAAIAVAEREPRAGEYVNPEVERLMRSNVVNVDDATIYANIQSSLRRGYPQLPQIGPVPTRDEVICIVGSGPSLRETEDELRALAAAGAKVVALNGAYRWCLDRGLPLHTQIIMDARPSNARFLEPAVPDCRYVLASQCAPDVWNAVAGRPHVWIFHAAYGPGAARDLLDQWYAGQWLGVGGGVTVCTRALTLLTMCGWSKFHLFGIDSCWMGGAHHAFPQPENDDDEFLTITVDDPDQPGSARIFRASPWQIKQAEDFALMVRLHGDHFMVDVHGDGLIAYVLSMAAQAVTVEEGV